MTSKIYNPNNLIGPKSHIHAYIYIYILMANWPVTCTQSLKIKKKLFNIKHFLKIISIKSRNKRLRAFQQCSSFISIRW